MIIKLVEVTSDKGGTYLNQKYRLKEIFVNPKHIVALREDKKTIEGIIFDHKGETAGLGAEISQQWFQDLFKEEKIFDIEAQITPRRIRDHLLGTGGDFIKDKEAEIAALRNDL